MAVPELRLSGGSSNNDPKGSLGGIMSSTAVTDNTLENAFDNITRSEALTGKTEYRCFYVYNPSGSPINGVTIEITTNPVLTEISGALDTVGKGDGSTSGVAQSIATEDTTPSGLKFFSEDADSPDGPYDTVVLPIGLLKAGEGVPFWLKRVTEQGAQQVLSISFKITYYTDTLPSEDVIDGGAIGEIISAPVVQATGTFEVGTARVGFGDIG